MQCTCCYTRKYQGTSALLCNSVPWEAKKTVQAFLHLTQHLSQPMPTHKYRCKRISTRILVHMSAHANKQGPSHAHVVRVNIHRLPGLLKQHLGPHHEYSVVPSKVKENIQYKLHYLYHWKTSLTNSTILLN